MIVVARVTEGQYQGLHGIESIGAFEIRDTSELEDWFIEEADYLINWVGDVDFESSEEYEDALGECCLEIYEVLDTKGLTVDELDRELNSLGFNLFLTEYKVRELPC